MGPHFAVTSRYLSDRQRTSSSQNPSIIQFQIMGDKPNRHPTEILVSDEYIILEPRKGLKDQEGLSNG